MLCDLDGTLAPIVSRPELVRLVPGGREALAAVAGRYGLVAMVSGRALADLERIVGLPGAGLAFSGNHGTQVRRRDGTARTVPEVEPHMPAIRAFAAEWGTERLSAHDVWLEDKGVTLTYHYREAPDPEAARAALALQVEPAARAAGLRTREGRMIVEVIPDAPVHKGTAARALLAGSGCRTAVYLGDDRTDVDAWVALRALRDEGALDAAPGLAVIHDESPDEVRRAADAELAGPAEARDVLAYLAESAASS